MVTIFIPKQLSCSGVNWYSPAKSGRFSMLSMEEIQQLSLVTLRLLSLMALPVTLFNVSLSYIECASNDNYMYIHIYSTFYPPTFYKHMLIICHSVGYLTTPSNGSLTATSPVAPSGGSLTTLPSAPQATSSRTRSVLSDILNLLSPTLSGWRKSNYKWS